MLRKLSEDEISALPDLSRGRGKWKTSIIEFVESDSSVAEITHAPYTKNARNAISLAITSLGVCDRVRVSMHGGKMYLVKKMGDDR